MVKIMKTKANLVDCRPYELQPNEYCYYDKVIFAMTPNGLCANLTNHNCVYNTLTGLTVTPSILCDNGDILWHGYITNDEWIEC